MVIRARSMFLFFLFASVANVFAGDSIYKNPGAEIVDFTSDMFIVIKPHQDLMLKEKDVGLGALAPVMQGGTVNVYDTIKDAAGKRLADKREGKISILMLRDIDAVREKKGTVIEFSGSKTFEKKEAGRQAGDVWTETGSLDLKNNFLKTESQVKRGGEVIERYVFEMARLPSGVWLMQSMEYVADRIGNKGNQTKIRGSFTRFDKSVYRHIDVSKAAKADFSYGSLRGKGDLRPDDLAKDYEVTKIIDIKDGKIAIEKKDGK